MNYFTILNTVETSTSADWTTIESLTNTPEGHHSVFVFHEDASITIAWGMPHNDGDSWTEKWSESGGFPDKRIFGHYYDIRYNGVTIHRDLVLGVDGHRCLLPSGAVIADDQVGITGMTVTEPELRRARLLDELVHGPASNFERYSKSANIQVA